MKHVWTGRRNFFVGVAVTGAALLTLAAPAWANAPNPETTTIDQVVVNSDGSTTVTVSGTWTWQTQSNCPTARNGVGYQIDWFDNTANAIGTAKDPEGILYVGDAQDNIVHSIETLGGSTDPGNAFWDGVPSSYVAHQSSSTTPTQEDAKNWLSQCDGLNSSGVTAGSWGPITHTYAPNATQPLKLCPIMYDPHGGHDNSGQSSVKDITAGANASTKNYNNDNSYETNQTGPGPGFCSTIAIPALTTSASSAQAPSSIHDTATLSNTGGQTGSITFNLYPVNSGCKGTPLFTSTVATKGDGDYTSDSHGPTSAGTYQWQATYSSSTVKGLITPCDDPNEQSPVSPPSPHGKPGISVLKLASVPCSALPGSDINPKPSEPAGVLPCNGPTSVFTHGTITVQVPHSGSYSIPVDYEIQVQNTGSTSLVLSLNDPLCDSGTVQGPFQTSGTLTGSTLSAGGKAYYTCTHKLTPNDPAALTNTATVTGQPPSGPPVHGTSTVTTDRVSPFPPHRRRECRSIRTGRLIRWPFGHPKPRACRAQPGHSGHGFTG